jgi:ABC-type multidrug transport system ATPase subunit
MAIDPTPLIDAVEEAGSATSPAASIGVELRAERISVSVAVPGTSARKSVLRDVTCAFEPGAFCALMGPSGAGKTTLLNALRTGNCSTGALLANGAPYTRLARRSIVTVPQDDILLPGLSPLEMLHYAAQLKLPASLGAAGRLARARAVLAQLHFSGADMATRIGSVDARGLSGGQRKRVSIGLELLTNPPVLLVDEPTSGLDAKMAADVVAILKQLASEGRTVVCTLHQPSLRIFESFDSLVLLASGRLAYAGGAQAAAAYFATVGVELPPRENPAEFYLHVLQQGTAERGEGAAAGGREQPSEQPSGSDLLDAWAARETPAWRWAEEGGAPGAGAAAPGAPGATSELAMASGLAVSAGLTLSAAALTSLAGESRYAVSQWAQLRVLLSRRLYDASKDSTKLGRSLALKLTLGCLVGVIWVNKGRDASFEAAFPTSGALFLVVNNCVMDTLFETVLQFPTQRALLQREYANGSYSLPAYYGALQLANLLQATLSACLLAAPVYSLVGLSAGADQVAYFVAILALMSCIGSSLGIIVGATSADLDSARGAIVPTLVPLLIFSGYLIPFAQIAPYFRWAYYASFFQYSLGALEINEFAHRAYSRDCPAARAAEAAIALIHATYPHVPLPPLPANYTTCSGRDYLEAQGLYPLKYGGRQGYALILCGYLAVLLCAAYAVLAVRTRRLVL